MTLAPVYLDHQASTPLDPRVKAAMERHESLYANPHTTSHLAGIEAGRAVDTARRNVARAIGGDARRVVFTSGATEANNLALFGVARAAVKRRKILVIASEHSSVVEPAFALKDEGFDIQLLPVDADGIVDLDFLERAVDECTLMVSAMHVNNETGVVQPVAEIAQICHRHGALLHSDCAQSLGRLPVRVAALGPDLLTLSGHKCYGPKGIGALYISANRKVPIKPICHGGGQQGGLRPGTLPVPLCVGFGEACRIAALDLDADGERMGRLGAELLEAILETCPGARLNGSWLQRVPGAFNVCFPGAVGDELLSAFDGIYVSSGSACESDVVEPSRVLLTYGLSESEADASLRFCVGRFTEDADIEIARRIVARGVRRLGLAKRTAA